MLESTVAEYIVAESIFSGFYVLGSIVWKSHDPESIVAYSNVARFIVTGSICQCVFLQCPLLRGPLLQGPLL